MTGQLIVDDIYTAYDRADVLSGLSIAAMPGRITRILGSNGAGKSTLIRSILRLTPPRAGSISFGGRTLDGLQTHEVVGLGIACVPEGRRIFARMTVEENLRVGACLVASERTIRTSKPSRGSGSAPSNWPGPCRAESRRWCRSAEA